MRNLFCPGLLETGPITDRVWAVRQGFMNFFVVRGPTGLVCIDAGWHAERLVRSFQFLGLDRQNVVAVLLTHRHWDHARGLGLFGKAEVFAGEQGKPSLLMKRRQSTQSLTRVRDGQILSVAGLAIHSLGTPGHTPDSVSYVVENRFLFTGDTIRLRQGEVLPFFPFLNHDNAALRGSLGKLARLKGVEYVLTAHTGMTRDPTGAFRRWRDSAPEASGPEGGRR